jgi:predicted RNase H-like HicB family nuclease
MASFHESEGQWYARALPFDIIGVGDTRAEALKLMKELVEDYLEEFVKEIVAGNEIGLFNPSDREEWNRSDTQHFTLHMRLTGGPKSVPKKKVTISEVSDLVEFINSLDSIESIELVPV